MRTKAINQLADVICRAQGQDRTPAGIAFAIESAGLLQSPETAAELERLRALVESMCAALTGHDCPDPNKGPMETATSAAIRLMEAEARVAELEAGVEETRPVDEDPIAYELTPAALVEDPRPALVKLKAPETVARLRWLMGGGPRV